MADLLPYYTVFTGTAAIVSVVCYVTYFRSRWTDAASSRPHAAGNENAPASTGLAA
ncbi:hypothetical protein [Methylobacterium durans]|uniref:hypothetical protein n=1 Tax=Methylobacterium durans TaxID=2202825 RepID=UPI0013A53721|nr:hypothetical protein [Methylobacterium durans]